MIFHRFFVYKEHRHLVDIAEPPTCKHFDIFEVILYFIVFTALASHLGCPMSESLMGRVKVLVSQTLVEDFGMQFSLVLCNGHFFCRSMPFGRQQYRAMTDWTGPSVHDMLFIFRNGYLDVIHYLVTSGKVRRDALDVHNRSLVFTAVVQNKVEVLEFLVKKVL